MTEREEEDRKIRELVNTNFLDTIAPPFGGRGGRRSTGRSRVWRRTAAVRPTIMKPPEGYVCRRCGEAGHFIQHCHTNGDPNYDVKIVRRPMGIPKSMLASDPDGGYLLANGDAAVMQPDEGAFEREIECVPSQKQTFSVADLPPELLCPLCKTVMKYAVLTGKCCFRSFCDGCIREYLLGSRLKCVCGAEDMLADYLLPNLTLRKTIARFLVSGPCKSSNASCTGGESKQTTTLHVQDQGSRRETSSNAVSTAAAPITEVKKASSLVEADVKPNPLMIRDKGSRLETSSNALSSAAAPTKEEKNASSMVVADEKANGVMNNHQMCKKARTGASADVSKATFKSGKGPACMDSFYVAADGGVQKQPVCRTDTGKKKRKRTSQDVESQETQCSDNYEMHAPYVYYGSYNPYWTGMPTGMGEYGALPSYGAMGHGPYNPYWTGMRTGTGGYGAPPSYGPGQLGHGPGQFGASYGYI